METTDYLVSSDVLDGLQSPWEDGREEEADGSSQHRFLSERPAAVWPVRKQGTELQGFSSSFA